MKIVVPYSFLEECAEKNSCASLDMDEQSKSKGKIIAWKGKHWVCTSSVSSGAHGYLQADLRLCVPQAEYRGYPHHPEARGFHFYTGGQLRFKDEIWIMTDREITLVPYEDKHNIAKRRHHVSPIS